jgi:hypothetical protein
MRLTRVRLPQSLPYTRFFENAKVPGGPIDLIGCPRHSINPPSEVHKIIELSSFLSPELIEEATKMYLSGQSLRSISVKLDIPKTSLRDLLLTNGVVLRAHARQPYQFSGITKQVSIRNAPYGFCLVDGKLIVDPRENKIVQLILNWNQSGMSHGDISRKLNDKRCLAFFSSDFLS